jgi:hypothetical protein
MFAIAYGERPEFGEAFAIVVGLAEISGGMKGRRSMAPTRDFGKTRPRAFD